MRWLPLQAIARPVAALLVGISILVLLRGHNEPGGGFIGGLIAAAGFTVLALGDGVTVTRRRIGAGLETVTAGGLLLAALSGVGAILNGRPYMAADWWAEVLKIGKAGTPLLFDIGVFLVVAGASLMMVFRLLEGYDDADAPRGRLASPDTDTETEREP